MERYYMNLNSSELHLLCIIEMMSHSTWYSMGQSNPKSTTSYTQTHGLRHILIHAPFHHASALCLLIVKPIRSQLVSEIGFMSILLFQQISLNVNP